MPFHNTFLKCQIIQRTAKGTNIVAIAGPKDRLGTAKLEMVNGTRKTGYIPTLHYSGY